MKHTKRTLEAASVKRILIVDDDPVIQKLLASFLAREEYALTQALSGAEALQALENGAPFDLVLLDIMLPKMSGYEICQYIRKTYPPHELPIIMVTAQNRAADVTKSFAAGANDYLMKPFSQEELLARIHIHLNLLNINRAYERFIPHEFLRFLHRESIVEVRLGDHVEQEMTVLFSDIRDFTPLSEMMTPEETFKLLNSYLSQMEPVIMQYQGFIDKYVGDTIMALFPTSADDAVHGSIAMIKKLNVYNEGRKRAGYLPIRVGIGLNTGLLMLGTVGGQHRMDSTVISDAVNLASRLEGLTKLFGVTVLMSEYTLFGLHQPEDFNVRFLGRVQVKGKQEIVSIFEVFDGDPADLAALKLKTKAELNDALILYFARKFPQAVQGFNQILHTNPHDTTAKLYLKRSTQFMIQGVPDDWQGIETMEGK